MTFKSKILFISPFYYPEKISSAKYNRHLVDSLLKRINVDVYCMHPFYPDWKTEKVGCGKNIFRPNWTPKFPKSILLKRLILEIGFFISTFFYVFKNKNKYDGLICISPPSLFLMVSIFFKKKIVIVHDLQSIHSSESTFILKFFSSFIRMFEKYLLSKFDIKYFLSNEMLNYVNLSNSFVFYPSFNVIKKKNLYFENKLNINNKTIIYSGALGEKQNPYKFIEFIKKFVEVNSDFCCYIFSSGPIFEHLKKIISLKNIRFYSLVDDKELFSLYNNEAIHFIPQKSNTSKGSLPSKLPNLLYCNSKIISIIDKDSELDNILKDFENNIRLYKWGYFPFFEAIIKLSKLKRKKNSSNLLSKFNQDYYVKKTVKFFNDN